MDAKIGGQNMMKDKLFHHSKYLPMRDLLIIKEKIQESSLYPQFLFLRFQLLVVNKKGDYRLISYLERAHSYNVNYKVIIVLFNY
jgi:hypothetical protein